MFTEYCITGKYDSLLGTLENIETSLAVKFHLRLPESKLLNFLLDMAVVNVQPRIRREPFNPIHWMSTGVSINDSFPDD